MQYIAFLKIWLHNGTGITIDVSEYAHHCINAVGSRHSLSKIDQTTYKYQPNARQTVPFMARLAQQPSLKAKFEAYNEQLRGIDKEVDILTKFSPTGPIELIIYTNPGRNVMALKERLQPCCPVKTL